MASVGCRAHCSERPRCLTHGTTGLSLLMQSTVTTRKSTAHNASHAARPHSRPQVVERGRVRVKDRRVEVKVCERLQRHLVRRYTVLQRCCTVLQRCCTVLQRCCTVLQRCCTVLQHNMLHCFATCCNMCCVAACCTALQHGALCLQVCELLQCDLRRVSTGMKSIAKLLVQYSARQTAWDGGEVRGGGGEGLRAHNPSRARAN